MDNILKSIYYDASKAGSFSGDSALLNQARKVDKTIKKKDVELFLSSQDTYSLHKPVRFKYKRAKTKVSAPHEYWQIDLSDLSRYSNYNNEYKFIFFIIDVYSRYLWLEKIKNKSPRTVASALENIFNKEQTIPAYLWCDMGLEFTSGEMKRFVSDCNIGIIHTYGNSKAGIVERVQRTIKTRMHRYFTFSHSYRYIDILHHLAESYNKTFHRSLKCTPLNMLKNPSKCCKKVKNTSSSTLIEKKELKIGSTVRISRTNRIFAKGFHKGWSTEIFKTYKISRQFSVTLYYLEDLNGEKLDGGFYKEEIQLVNISKDKVYKIEKNT